MRKAVGWSVLVLAGLLVAIAGPAALAAAGSSHSVAAAAQPDTYGWE